MDVKIKSFDVEMKVKSSGIELEISKKGGGQIGDCFATMKGLIWCQGRKDRKNGITITWDDLSTLCSSKEALKKAVKCAKEEGNNSK